MMRLLNALIKTLEEFEARIPPYAILSHTWGRQEVVYHVTSRIPTLTIQPWPAGTRLKSLASKLCGTSWVMFGPTTICIDKSSSAELSESINSMFRWYRELVKCYCYLCDLPDVPFAESRWLTRGWTLQEMIAPEELEFYDKEWRFRGTKSELVDELEAITKVDKNILQGGSLRLKSIAKRRSWAANRVTTRVEDRAYSLLGLFAISMPMLYGEGEKAFIRLQEELVREYDDQSLFCWASRTLDTTAGLFANSPGHFAGSANIVPVCWTTRAEHGNQSWRAHRRHSRRTMCQ
jgi:hypothetical protein